MAGLYIHAATATQQFAITAHPAATNAHIAEKGFLREDNIEIEYK